MGLRSTWLTGAGLLVAAVVPASAAASITLGSGRLVDAGGRPSGDTVVAYAWPSSGEGRMTEVARTTAAPNGSFTLTSEADTTLRSMAARNRGQVDLLIDGQTASGFGEHYLSVRQGEGGRAATASDGSATFRLAADRAASAKASVAKGCAGVLPQTRKLSSTGGFGIIGEINNAYRDSVQSFTYGNASDTSISVMVAPEGGGFAGKGSRTVTRGDGSEIKRSRQGVYARKILSKFVFGKYHVSRCGRDNDSTFIRADEWAGGFRDRRQVNTVLVCPPDVADNDASNTYTGDDEFHRWKNDAVTWAGGASAFGIGLDIKSGYSTTVRTDIVFGGPTTRPHIVCGSGGQAPTVAGRIFSGLRT